MKRILLHIVMLCLAFAVSSAGLRGEVKAVKGEGFVSFGMNQITDNDKARSRSEALKECLSDAVRQFVAKNIPKKLFEDNDSVLKARLYSNYGWFLVNYRIREEKEEDGLYKITAEVLLNSSLIKQKLAEMGFLQQRAGGKPSLVILISHIETMDAESHESAWWVRQDLPQKGLYPPLYEQMEKRLSSMGFPIVDKLAFLARIEDAKVSLKKKMIKGDLDILRRFDFGDILVMGSMAIVMQTKDRKPHPKRLSFSVSSMSLRDGFRIADLEKTYFFASIEEKLKELGKAPGTEDIINYACDDFSSQLVESIVTNWQRSASQVRAVLVDINGITGYDQYKGFRDLFDELKPDVFNFTDWQMGKAFYRFRLDINGTPEGLARKIAKRKVAGSSVEIRNVSDDSITVVLK